MKSRNPTGVFAPHELQQFILPITISSVIIMAILMAQDLVGQPPVNLKLMVYGAVVIVGTVINNAVLARTGDFRQTYGWLNAFLTGIALGLLPYVLSENLSESSHILIPLGVVAVAIVSGRSYAYTALMEILIINLWQAFGTTERQIVTLEFVMPFIISIVFVEAILHVKYTTQQQIHRLEIINNFSRQVRLSLEPEKTLSLLDNTIREALNADTYFIGILRNDEIHLDLCNDEGEYYNGTKAPMEGTLSGWVIKNQKELFLPDLRREADLEGVEIVIVGKEKVSLSWIGVPLTAPNVTGVIALGSYKPNAFDSGDMQLLSNLAQHITLALDNTIRHAQVEEQARLDSLTGVYNHGYFLKNLATQASEAARNNSPLSLIMLDIDYFKQFNDTYGHLVGDRILKTLCTAIKHHIKQSDAVGRWGGEEFVISLPGATGPQALQVAERVGQTMAQLRMEDRDQRTIPVPTVSQGIAIFPFEANEIYQLIDLADRRLYAAKARGRNQIEPPARHWEKIQNQ
jgi:diguanylate cyclase (GGDEF)-like protein